MGVTTKRLPDTVKAQALGFQFEGLLVGGFEKQHTKAGVPASEGIDISHILYYTGSKI